MENQQDEKQNGFTPNRLKFEKGLMETKWTDAGTPYYVIRDSMNLAEYAALAKAMLEEEKIIGHDFTSKVVNESRTHEEPFTYKSGWFLEGIAEHEEQ